MTATSQHRADAELIASIGPHLRVVDLHQPTTPRLAGVTEEGAEHAKSALDSQYSVEPGRRQQDSAKAADATCLKEIGLTQQATNSTCVTARRDGHPIDLASPEQVEARTKRIAAADHKRRTRLADMCAARELIRHNEILTAWELFNLLNTVMASMRCAGASDMERWRTTLAEVASDLEDELTNHGEVA
jgi:hypothetical protein